MDPILDFLLYLVEFAIGLGASLFLILFVVLYAALFYLVYKALSPKSTSQEKDYDQFYDSQF